MNVFLSERVRVSPVGLLLSRLRWDSDTDGGQKQMKPTLLIQNLLIVQKETVLKSKMQIYFPNDLMRVK